jgi:hypothetical protein
MKLRFVLATIAELLLLGLAVSVAAAPLDAALTAYKQATS